jgi:hypothetical protein
VLVLLLQALLTSTTTGTTSATTLALLLLLIAITIRCNQTANNMTSTTAASGFNYPHRVLTPITDTPGYSSLQNLQKELYTNAQATMHSNAGGGNHGHLALVMPDVDYLALAGQVFIIPQHPGNLPVHAVGATGPQITETNRQYDANLAAYMRCKEVEAALREQILTAVNNTFLVALEHEELGHIAMPQVGDGLGCSCLHTLALMITANVSLMARLEFGLSLRRCLPKGL